MDYASLALTADDLIGEFGSTGTLTRVTPGDYDPDTATATPASTTTQSIKAVVIDYEHKYVDGTLIKTGDKQCFVSAKDITAPAQGDRLTWFGIDYQLVSVTPLAPAGTVLFYELQARQ
jgi:hypothetical protein